MNIIKGTRKCALVGGPWDGYQGDFIDNGQRQADFKGFIYVRGNESRNHVTWKYDAEQTDRLMVQKGIHPRTGERLS
jgi:hypothetical protein